MKKFLIIVFIMIVLATTYTEEKTQKELINKTENIIKKPVQTNNEITGAAIQDWCPEGETYILETEVIEIEGEFLINEYITTGKYAGLCHVTLKAKGGGKNIDVEYYIDEEGNTKYIVTEWLGKRYEQELT